MSYSKNNYQYLYPLGILMRETSEETIDQLLYDFPPRTLAALKYHFILGIHLKDIVRVLRDNTYRKLENLRYKEAYERLKEFSRLEKMRVVKEAKL